MRKNKRTSRDRSSPIVGLGAGVEASRKKRRGKRFADALFILLLSTLVYPAYVGWQAFYTNFLEKVTPEIHVEGGAVGLGTNELKIPIRVLDAGSGLELVIVRGDQDGETRVLRKVSYPRKKNEDTIEVILSGRESGFREGELRLSISAFDRSYWSNSRLKTVDLMVDYSKPKLEVISTQHNTVLGGTGLVFYKLDEKNDSFSGVKVGGSLFPGFEASKLDDDFKPRPDVYFSFFAIPIDFNTDLDRIELFATDVVGNISTSSMYYRVRNKKYNERGVALSEEFLKSSVTKLSKSYIELQARVALPPLVELGAPENSEELVRRFRLINEDFRDKVESLAQPLFVRPRTTRLWHGAFERLAGSAQQAPFGEMRYYGFGELNAGSSLHAGVDLASRAHASVRAANEGVVVYADELGLYGKAVIIDHGFGLNTLYAHLSSIAVSEGESVKKATVLGKTGNTGLAQGDHLHFEVRIHGVPVRPEEWWDQNWVKGHIDTKIKNIKLELGLRVATPLR